MKYSALIAYYQENLLTEKDTVGFDGIGKLSRSDTKHMNVTTTKDKNEYLPYNDVPRNLSNAANQALKRVQQLARGKGERISNELAIEILANYNRGGIAELGEREPKQLNSKSPLSIVKFDNQIYLQNN